MLLAFLLLVFLTHKLLCYFLRTQILANKAINAYAFTNFVRHHIYDQRYALIMVVFFFKRTEAKRSYFYQIKPKVSDCFWNRQKLQTIKIPSSPLRLPLPSLVHEWKACDRCDRCDKNAIICDNMR